MNRDLSRRTLLHGLGSAAVLAAYPGGHALAASDQVGGIQLAANSGWLDGASQEWERVMKAARAEGQVTVAGFPALGEKMSAAFLRDTGIKLSFLGGRSREQAARFAAEARAKNMSIDVLIGGGSELSLIKEGLLNQIPPQLMLPGVSPKHFRNGTHKFMDSGNQYLLQGAEWVFGWLTVNKDVIDPAAIRTWKDLLDPKYKGKIIAHDPRGPGPGQGATSWLYNTFGIDFVKDLFLGQQAKYTSDTRNVVESVVRGTYPIAFAAIQFQVERFRREGFKNLAIVLPSDAPGYITGGFSVLKQAKGVPHPNASTVFINWYVSKPGQEVYESVMLETSRRLDVETGLPDYLKPKAGVNYFEAYNENIYFSRRKVVGEITRALGSR